MAQNAIAAVSYLAGEYADESARASSAQIARARNLPQTLVAKVLTMLSQANYVIGSPGPNGGYRLARAPNTITFYDIVENFGTITETFPCPFGIGYCPNDSPCPLHDKMVTMRESVENFLKETHFGSFENTENQAPPAA